MKTKKKHRGKAARTSKTERWELIYMKIQNMRKEPKLSLRHSISAEKSD